MVWLFVKKNIRFQMPMYLLSYGVWRFVIEYLRGDERGETIVSFLSPSQLTSIGLIAAGILVLVFELRADCKRTAETLVAVSEESGAEEARRHDEP